MTREKARQQILDAMRSKGLTFQEIAEADGLHRIRVTAALLGQSSLDVAQSERAANCLGLGPDIAEALQQCPMKGSLSSTVPVDPLIYRFHEITQVYGTTIKALIHEMFGDGIMSAIDFTMEIEHVPDPHGDRVRVTYDGKFLPFEKW